MTQVTLHEGDNREHLRRLLDQGVRVHAVVTDPPYGLTSVVKRFGKEGAAPAKQGTDGAFARASGGFMGKVWDGTGIERDPEFWRLIWEILLPGGFVFAFSGSRTGHWQACAMETAGFIMHPMHGWVYGCLDPETDCLTRRGWVHYCDLLPDDQVAQWDSKTGLLSWVVPTAVHEYDFDGHMVMIENRHTRQMLTPNHRVYAKVRRHSRHHKPDAYEVVSAEDIDRRPSNWQVDLPLAAPLSEGVSVDPAYAYLAGWWMTDAWPHKDGNACMFSQAKPKTLAKLRAALEPHGASEYVKIRENPSHQNEHSFYLTGEMADRLRCEFPDRALPWSVMSWGIDARRALYEGLMDGDGSRERRGDLPSHAEAFWSLRQERRDVFLALALSLGIRAYDDPKKGVVYVNASRSTTQVQGKHRSQRIPYKGKVWCLTVPTGAFVARRDGRPFITGNSGFPKAHNPCPAIDKVMGVEGGRGAPKPGHEGHMGKDNLRSLRDSGTMSQDGGFSRPWMSDPEAVEASHYQYAPTSPEAKKWDGWRYGTQTQKPALEPIYLGQKPYSEKTGHENLLKHGVGAVNIDDCRIEAIRPAATYSQPNIRGGQYNSERDKRQVAVVPENLGRWPANLLHDGSAEVVALFPQSAGQQARVTGLEPSDKTDNAYGEFAGRSASEPRNDSGSAARFFNSFPDGPDADAIIYHAKATKADRAGSKHPTVKPIGLMEHLIRHITPPGGVVLDPFAGSGTTAQAARNLGFDCILMEQDPDYAGFLRQRFALPSVHEDYNESIVSHPSSAARIPPLSDDILRLLGPTPTTAQHSEILSLLG